MQHTTYIQISPVNMSRKIDGERSKERGISVSAFLVIKIVFQGCLLANLQSRLLTIHKMHHASCHPRPIPPLRHKAMGFCISQKLLE